MRRYDDPVEVRRGLVADPSGADIEGPEQFLWRGRLWKVRAVLAYWVETGPWWQSAKVRAALGADADAEQPEEPGPQPLGELLTERELWRVEAGRGGAPDNALNTGEPGGGVFDLCFDWADGRWQLVGCVD
jgi:Domain of unknown function (DUF6504)